MAQTAEQVGSDPVVGFTITITINCDDIADLLAYGRKLRDAEDSGGEEITTLKEAAREVAWLFAYSGSAALFARGGIDNQLDSVSATALLASGASIPGGTE
jgi:hypothetical protein